MADISNIKNETYDAPYEQTDHEELTTEDLADLEFMDPEYWEAHRATRAGMIPDDDSEDEDDRMESFEELNFEFLDLAIHARGAAKFLGYLYEQGIITKAEWELHALPLIVDQDDVAGLTPSEETRKESIDALRALNDPPLGATVHLNDMRRIEEAAADALARQRAPAPEAGVLSRFGLCRFKSHPSTDCGHLTLAGTVIS